VPGAELVETRVVNMPNPTHHHQPWAAARAEPLPLFFTRSGVEGLGLLQTMWRERGLTMVLVTHDSAIARRAQHIGIMKNGRLSIKHAPRPDAPAAGFLPAPD